MEQKDSHGGSSGGGSINIFAKLIKEKGNLTANGGQISATNIKGKGRRRLSYNKRTRFYPKLPRKKNHTKYK